MFGTNSTGIFSGSTNQQCNNTNNGLILSNLEPNYDRFTTNSSRPGLCQKTLFSNGVNSNQKTQNTFNLLGNQTSNNNQIQGKFSLGTSSAGQNGAPGGSGNLLGGSGGISNGTNIFGGGNNNIFQNQNLNPNIMFQSSTNSSNLFPQPQTNPGLMTPVKQGSNSNQSNNQVFPNNTSINQSGIFQKNLTNNNNSLNMGVLGNTQPLINQQPSNVSLQANGSVFNQTNQMSNQNSYQTNLNQNQRGTYHINFQPASLKEKEGEKASQFMFIGFHLNKSQEELRYEDFLLKKSGAKLPQINNNQNNNILGVFSMAATNNIGGGSNNTSVFANSNTNVGIGATSQLFSNSNSNSSNIFNQNGVGNTSNQSHTTNQSNMFANTQSNQGNSNQGGIFGQPTGNNNQSQSGGLFNQNNTAQAGQFQKGGLFPSNPMTNNSNTTAQPQFGSLSNQTQNTTNQNQFSLFNTNTNNNQTTSQPQQNQTSNLFSNPMSNSTNPSTSNQNQPQSSGGLFNQGTQSNGGSLFNPGANTSSNPTQQNQQTSLLSNPGGSSSLFQLGQPQSDANKAPGSGSSFSFGPGSGSSSLFQPSQTNDPSKSNTSNNQSSLFSPIPTTGSNTTTTQQTSLFQNPSNPTTSTNQQQQQPITYIPAPSNILGIDLNSVSPMVKSAVLGSKKMKDFINEVEAEFLQDEYQGYYSTKRKPSTLSKLNTIDDYYRKYEHTSYLQRESKSKYSYTPSYDYGIYANLPMYSNLKSNAEYNDATETSYLGKYTSIGKFPESDEYRTSFLQTKRHQEREKDYVKDYDFNKNIIEINQKINYDRYNKGGSYEKYQESNKKRRVENGSDEKSLYYRDQNLDENIITSSSYRAKVLRPEIKIDPKNLDLLSSEEKHKQTSNINVTPSNEKVIDVTIIIKKYQGHDLPINLKVNKNNKVSLLKDFYAERLRVEYSQLFRRVKSENITLIKANSLMKDSKMMHEYDIKNDDVLFASISMKHHGSEEEYNRLENNMESPLKRRRLRGNSIAPIESLPNLTKPGYNTNPDFIKICRMTADQLKNVHNFEVSNEFGKIQWKEKVDLTGLNLDDIVEIKDSMITLYKGRTKLPPSGLGLNKPFRISMKIIPKNEEALDDFEETLKNYVRKVNGIYEEYDYKSNFLIFSCDEIQA
jgi:hypothetical protein